VRRFTTGLLLITIGGLLLLQTLGLASGISFGSVVLILVGLSIAGDGLRGRRRNVFSLGLGLWLAAMGLFGILSRAGLTTITGGDVARMGWPVLLIFLGLSMLMGRGLRVHVISSKKSSSTEFPTQIVGDLRYGAEPWALDDDLNLFTAVGDLRLDLTTAIVAPGTHRINVSQLVGEALVRVPDTVSVRATAQCNIGEVAIFGERRSGVGYVHLEREEIVPGSDSELIIDANLRIGSIRIERVPTADFRVF